MQDREFQEFRTTRGTGGGCKGIPNGLKQLGLVSCACLHCTLYGVAYVKPGQVCNSVDAVRRRFKLSQRFTCLRHVCSLKHSADQ